MRIDKFLKVSRIIKRRTVANEACSGGRVMINQKTAKPSSDVKTGDVISHYEVLALAETVSKNQASDMYRILEEDAVLSAERN